MGELSVWSSQGEPPPRGSDHTGPLHPLTFVSQHLHGASRASAHSEALSAVPPAHDQVCFDAASLSFTASMRHPRHTHKHHFQEGDCVNKKKKRKRRRRHCEKINACSGEHSRSSVDGRCLKHWQLSRDSDCLVGFLLHFRTEVAAFVVGSDITMHYTYSQTLCTAPLLLQHSVRNRLPTNSCLRCMFNWIC